VVLGNVVGSLFIRATEKNIVAGFEEPWSTVFLNIVTFSAAVLFVVVYSSASYGNWGTDILLGVVLGGVIGAAQGLSTYRRIVVIHCMALICALALILVALRILTTLHPVASTLLITAIATLAMVLIDYGPFGRSGD
jgi:peptidoglycan/LPS O-acetylase OafA/YrhL